IRRAAVDLPFVPTTCTASNERCGLPRRSSNSTMRSVPNPSLGHGLSDSIQLVADCIELATVPLELFALGVHDLGGCVPDEPLVAEHRFRAPDLLAQALAFGVDVAVGLGALGLHHRVEDAALVAVELRNHAGATEHRCRFLHAGERVGLGLI